MQLTVGERLEGSGTEQQPGGYVVTGVVSETPWYGLYAAKKVFYNFDFTAKRVRETDEKEWLDVFLRTIRYPILDQADYVSRRRALARAEVRAVLGSRHSNLWPEPIDLVELEESRDPFSFAVEGSDGREPIVVFARPHGRFLPAWLNQVLPVSSVLAVLAELLEFIHQAHAEGLLLLGLSPDAVVIDALERVHYVGSDMAVSQANPMLTERNGSDAWSRFFPPERFPRGFAATECFLPGRRPDRRSDLYAWGCLVYLLLTGESPVQLAQDQGRRWALFQDEHFARLHAALNGVPGATLKTWADQLGIPSTALAVDWPGHLTLVMRQVLSPNPNRRPGTVAELRSWFVVLPPPAVSGMVALQLMAGEAKLLLDCSALETDLRLRIRRGRGAAPVNPEGGEVVYDGPVRPIVVDGDLPLSEDPTPTFYTVWTAKGGDGQATYSAAVSEGLWQPSPANLVRWADQQAEASPDPLAYPPRVAMVLSAIDPVEAASSLARSTVPRVRSWGLHRVEQALHSALRYTVAEPVLWQYLRDPLGEVRQAAAVAVWNHSYASDDETLLRLLEALEAPPLDTSPPLVSFLNQLGLPDSRIAQLLQALEQRRPTTCPLCQQRITMGERVRHLCATHGYVSYEGDAIPYVAAVARLWERVLHRQETLAHDRLLALYQNVTPVGAPQPPGLTRYVADLGKRMLGQPLTGGTLGLAVPVALPFAAFDNYTAMLRSCSSFLPIVRAMLQLGNPQVRDLGRNVLLPVLAEGLRGAPATPEAVWAALEDVCPGAALIEERLRLCQRLPGFGADAAAVSACAARLEDERLVACSACGAQIRSKDIEAHLRRAHNIYEFRGVQRSLEETRWVLLNAVCGVPTDPRAWRHLRGLATDRFPQDADRTLVTWLYQHLKDLDSDKRPSAAVGVAEALAGDDRAAAILSILVGPGKNPSYEQLGRRIALELAARLPAPVADETMAQVNPLLSDKELPRKGRQRAVVALLKSTGRSGPAALDLLRAYVAGSGKLRSIEKLRQLEQRFGQAPAIDELTRALEDEVRMTCPRCPTQLRKKDMVGHLWERHSLVLDGQQVREPWRVLADWVVDYNLEKDPELLQRCRQLAQRVNGEAGVTRLHRMMLGRGVQDPDIAAALVAQAKARQSSLCPYCRDFVPGPAPPEPEALTWERDHVEGEGYRIELAEGGVVPKLRIESPDAVLYDSREPGRWVTRRGALLLVMGVVPFMISLLWGATRGQVSFALIVLLAGIIGLVMAGFVYIFWPAPAPARLRLLRAAWNRLVPEMVHEPLDRAEWAVLHGLAQRSAEVESGEPGTGLLAECCEAVSEAGTTDALAGVCLAELCRLYLPRLRESGGDVALFVADRLAAVFAGRASPFLLGALCEQIQASGAEWQPADRRRLGVLVAERAFAQGLSADDLVDIARVFPAAEVLGLDDRWRWGQLDLLWSMAGTRAWEKTGLASTVFEMARASAEGEALLAESPNLLLCVRRQALHVTSSGIWILGHTVTTRPDEKEIVWEWSAAEQGYLIEIGNHVLRTKQKPHDLVIELKAWLRFYFVDFLPKLPTGRGPVSEAAQRMWQPLRTPCRECNRPLVPCVGEVGIALR